MSGVDIEGIPVQPQEQSLGWRVAGFVALGLGVAVLVVVPFVVGLVDIAG